MKKVCTNILVFFVLACGAYHSCLAQDISLEPKYGSVQKSPEQRASDAKFLADVDAYYKGDRKAPSNEMAEKGWQALRAGNMQDAMRRFNQAWLLDGSNAVSLWGMAAVQASIRKMPESLKLFAEAEPTLNANTNFEVDYAKAMSTQAAQTKDTVLMKSALTRFETIDKAHPDHTANLQNWAISLFYMGDYANSWKKIQLAEKTPGRAGFDQQFISALEAKMARPK